MAFQIASLLAKISADTTDLNRGLKAADARLDETASKMGTAGTAAENADVSTKNFGKSLTQFAMTVGVVTGAVGAMAVVAKKAFDFSEEGAAVIQTAASFDRLGVSIEDLRTASRGTISDVELMASTLTLTAGASEELQNKMLDAAPQLLEIAKAANAVNPAIGDTAFMFDSLALGIKRASPRLIDNTNLVIKLGEANEAYAESLGKTVEELTAEDKQIALLNATLEAGNRLIEQAGGSTEAYGDAWAVVTAQIKNNTDAMKENAAEGLLPIVTYLAEYLRLAHELDQLDADPGLTEVAKWQNLSKAQEESVNVQRGMLATAERYTRLADYYASQQDKIEDSTSNLSAANLGSAAAYDTVAEAAKRAQGAVGNYSTEFYESIRAVRLQAEAELILGAVNSDLTKSFRETSDEMAGLRGERADLIAQLGELQGKADEAGGSFGEMVDNGKKISEIEGAIAGVTGKMDELIGKTRESIRSFILQQMQAQLAVDGWTESEIAFFKGTAERFGMYDELWIGVTTSVAEHALAVEDGSLTVGQAIDGMMGEANDLARAGGVLRETMPVAFDETANAAGRATGMIDSLVGVNSDAEGAFIDLRDTAVPAVDEVALAAGLVGSALMGAVADADLLKAALDLLAENDITIDVHFNVDELRVPTAGAQELQGPGLITPPKPIMNATGGDYIVSQPTSFMAGEAGTERVIVIPKGQPGFGGAGGGMGGGASKIEINVHGTNDPEAAANLVIRKLADRGIVAASGGLR